MRKCFACKGFGTLPGADMKYGGSVENICRACNGIGRLCEDDEATCEKCEGSGIEHLEFESGNVDITCDYCNGHGVVKLKESSSNPFSHQVGGSHYKDYAIEPYEFLFRNKIPHHKAAIIRRILRYDHPTGKGKSDLQKIRHELDLIEYLDEDLKGE